MSGIDERWSRVCEQLVSMTAGGPVPSAAERAFGDWCELALPSLRIGLRSYARVIDVESVVQDTAIVMWERAKAIASGQKPALEGREASLRLAYRAARNRASNMRRKHRREVLSDMEDDDLFNFTDPMLVESDPFLGERIRECSEQLKPQPAKALAIRLSHGHRPEEEQAALAGMSKNTFHQNILRARLQLKECLESMGITLGVFA